MEGNSFEETDAALGPADECDNNVRDQILGTVQNFGRVIPQGSVGTYARPFGGGPPRLLPQSAWELDDFRWRFGSSEIDPAAPFDYRAESTR